MSKDPGTLELVGQHLTLALKPLSKAVSDKERFRALMLQLGWNATDLPPAYAALGTAVDTAVTKFEALSDDPTPADILDLIGAVKNAYAAITGIADAPPGVDAAAFLAEIGERLFELLLTEYIAAELPAAYSLLQALNVIQVESVPAAGARPAFMRVNFQWDEIPKIVSEPNELPARVYGWGTPELNVDRIVHHLAGACAAIGFAVRTLPPGSRVVRAYTDATDGATPFSRPSLVVPFFYIEIAGVPVEAAIAVRDLPAANGKLPGIVIEPQIPPQFPLKLQLADDIAMRILAGTNIATTLGVLIRPDGISVKYPFQPGTPPPSAGVGLGFDFTPSTPARLFGSPGATRLEIKGGSIDFGASSIDGDLDVVLAGQLKGLALVLAAGDGDSFIKKIVGSGETRVEMTLGVEWSRAHGIRFTGSGAFEVAVHPHLELGPISIDQVNIRLSIPSPAPPDLRLELGASISGDLGPLAFVVEGIGVKVDATFSSGNMGPFDLDLGFKPPSGVGLSIDGGGFKGGGFLRFEPELAQYSGMLELEFQDQLTVKAIGLLNTRLPNGQSGFSLLIVISAEFTPIQLGLGFKLNGVGGLLGLNRTVKTDRLLTGLRDNTLSSILFPTDIIANADRIISDLRQVFPPEAGRFVFGPMAKITWGTPALLTADLGLILEVPEPIRLVILGVVRGIVPDEQAAILRLQVNFLGVIDFEQERFSFDASLFDSKLLAFTLTGDMAVRLYWGADANLLLTVGGFHPAFQPPPLPLPPLRRLTLALLDGDNPRLTLETYFAVTSNTVQLGARLELYAAAWKFNAYGFLSVDVLFQFNPFYFIAEVTAMLALRVGSSSIASIKLTLTLEGPTPWKAKGDARLKLCWFLTVKVRFNKTFGEHRHTTLPDVVVLPLLVAALSAPDNWEDEVPAQRHRLESLRDVRAAASAPLVVHPVGTLKISQKVAPLNIPIDRLGSQRPADAREFHIADVHVGSGGPGVDAPPAQESFAPAQFFDMSDADKLGSPSFKQFDSGIRVGDPTRIHAAYAAAREVQYELKYIDSQRDQRLASPGGLFTVDAGAFNAWALQGAIAKSALSFSRRRKSALAPDEVGVRQEAFAIVNAGDLKPFDGASVLSTEHAALKRREALIASNPALKGALQVVPVFEMSASL